MDGKQVQHDRGELSKRALNDYHRTAKHIAAFFGKGSPTRFAALERLRALSKLATGYMGTDHDEQSSTVGPRALQVRQ